MQLRDTKTVVQTPRRPSVPMSTACADGRLLLPLQVSMSGSMLSIVLQVGTLEVVFGIALHTVALFFYLMIFGCASSAVHNCHHVRSACFSCWQN